jgi:ribosome-binding protein aMBF1 (putative translation factor)
MKPEEITKEREARGWSKSELARRANMNQSTIGVIESGRQKPYPIQIEKIQKAFRESK